MMNYFEMTDDQIEKKLKLNKREMKGVSNLVSALKALPKSIYLGISDDGIEISKRITQGAGRRIKVIKKKSLKF